MNINYRSQSGFTLLELLVVIAIIGILAGVIMISTGDSIDKGKDAAIKYALRNAQVEAEFFALDHKGKYKLGSDEFCKSDDLKEVLDKVLENSISGDDAWGGGDANQTIDWNTVGCHNKATKFVIAAPLSNSTAATHVWWCVDSGGSAREVKQTGTIAYNATNGKFECP